MSTNYKRNDKPISDFVAGTNQSDTNGYTAFPGTNLRAQVNGNYDTLLLRPLPFKYSYQSTDLNLSRFAKYQDFTYNTSNTTEQSISTAAPSGTTHISGVLIGGGGGGGAGGGGNNPGQGSDRAGQPGGGGGSGAQLFFYKLPYNNTIKVIIGSGGANANCVYKQNGDVGGVGYRTSLINNGTFAYHANGGGYGNGGACGNANTHGNFVGTGGSKGNADGTVHTPNPSIAASTNTGNIGGDGIAWNDTIGSGGSGGSLNLLLGNVAYGKGGDGGTTNGTGEGASANDGHSQSGNAGFCRIYYLIE
jgi:hypothetical protein